MALREVDARQSPPVRGTQRSDRGGVRRGTPDPPASNGALRPAGRAANLVELCPRRGCVRCGRANFGRHEARQRCRRVRGSARPRPGRDPRRRLHTCGADLDTAAAGRPGGEGVPSLGLAAPLRRAERELRGRGASVAGVRSHESLRRGKTLPDKRGMTPRVGVTGGDKGLGDPENMRGRPRLCGRSSSSRSARDEHAPDGAARLKVRLNSAAEQRSCSPAC